MKSDFPTLALDIDACSRGTVKLDGESIANGCHGIDIRIRAGELPQITLHMHGNVSGLITGEITKPEPTFAERVDAIVAEQRVKLEQIMRPFIARRAIERLRGYA